MVQEVDESYAHLRHLIINCVTPGDAGLILLDFYEEASGKAKVDAKTREFARQYLNAAKEPSAFATKEMVRFARRSIEAMETLRAIEDAGWKTPVDEGREAFSVARERVKRPPKNPYKKRSFEHDWWHRGYEAASQKAYDAGKIPYTEEDRIKSESRIDTIETVRTRTMRHAKRRKEAWLAAFDIGGGEMHIAVMVAMLSHSLSEFPADLRQKLDNLTENKMAEIEDIGLERVISTQDKIARFDAFINAVREIFAEAERRKVNTPIGPLRGDPIEFSSRFSKWHRESFERVTSRRPRGQKRSPKKRRR